MGELCSAPTTFNERFFMTFICLAAGKGTRFGRLGTYLQKCMYPIGLKPFLEYSLESLMESGAFHRERDRLVFVVGHKQEQIREYFGDAYDGIPIRYVEQGEALGTGHAVHTGFQAVDADSPAVIAWLADSYIAPRVFNAMREIERANAITIARHDDGEPYGHRVDLDAQHGLVTRSWKGSSPYLEVGCWKLSQQSVRQLTAPIDGAQSGDGEFRALETLQHLIAGGLSVGFVESDGWIHLGGTKPTPEYHLRRVFETLAPDTIVDGSPRRATQ